MIEGLRLLPYFQETRRQGNAIGARPGSNDCKTCRAMLTIADRQDRGCVYEERTAAPQRGFVLRPLLPWRSVSGEAIIPSACPLYLGRVAESSDVLEALPMYRKGYGFLRAWLGRDPDRNLLECLDAAENGVEWWKNDPNGGARKAGA